MLNKVFIVCTGGTALANVANSSKGIDLQNKIEYLNNDLKIIENTYLKLQSSNSGFDDLIFTQPLNIFSEDLTFEDLIVLKEHLTTLDQYNPKAIIIIHGTDRLCFTSAFLSLTFYRAYPILVVGCQRSLDRPTSELQLNLNVSLKIVSKLKKGVWVLGFRTPFIFDILNPKYAIKLHSYNKHCFYSKTDLPQFQYNLLTNSLKKLSAGIAYAKPYIKYANAQLPKISVSALYPNCQQIDYSNCDYVIIIGTGLGNISKEHLATLPKNKTYVISVPLGPTRADIYSSSRQLSKHKIKHSEYTLDYLYAYLLTKTWIIK